jgi:hypothetical protein
LVFKPYTYFALAVYVRPFSGKVMSVVYAAALVKRDAIFFIRRPQWAQG